MTAVLNYMLVSWLISFMRMIQSHKGRSLLRRYANEAQTAFLRSLSIFQDFDIFQSLLRVLWVCRIRRFFNDNDIERLYLTYLYRSNDTSTQAEGNINLNFEGRGPRNLVRRRQLATQLKVDRILNIHFKDRHIDAGDSEIFDDYSRNGMSSAEYYFENHITEFYRVIFFFLELRAAKSVIHTDEDDIYKGRLPYELIPDQIQRIVYDDNSYCDYLLVERSFYEMLMGANAQSSIMQHLTRTSRVYKEDLIMLRTNMASTSVTQFRRTTLSTVSTTTIKSTISTTEHWPHKRKDIVWKNEHGKCFSKRVKTTPLDSSGSNTANNNLDTKNLDEFADSRPHKSYDYSMIEPIDNDVLLDVVTYAL